MCDYSLQHLASRPAKVGEKLVSTNFLGTISHGFASPEDLGVAVCLIPGTELAFDAPVKGRMRTLFEAFFVVLTGKDQNIATFRQLHKSNDFTHHDALEFPDGRIQMVHNLQIGQMATVLQLPAAPRTEAEASEQTRVAVRA
jgi:hypothetical protein